MRMVTDCLNVLKVLALVKQLHLTDFVQLLVCKRECSFYQANATFGNGRHCERLTGVASRLVTHSQNTSAGDCV